MPSKDLSQTEISLFWPDIAESAVGFCSGIQSDHTAIPSTVCVLLVEPANGQRVLLVGTSVVGNREAVPHSQMQEVLRDLRSTEERGMWTRGHRYWNGCGEQRAFNHGYNHGLDMRRLASQGRIRSCAISIRSADRGRTVASANNAVRLMIQCQRPCPRDGNAFGCEQFLEYLGAWAVFPAPGSWRGPRRLLSYSV